jgi:hypothetical protein
LCAVRHPGRSPDACQWVGNSRLLVGRLRRADESATPGNRNAAGTLVAVSRSVFPAPERRRAAFEFLRGECATERLLTIACSLASRRADHLQSPKLYRESNTVCVVTIAKNGLLGIVGEAPGRWSANR